MIDRFGRAVRLSVNFDHKANCLTDEIAKIWPKPLLAAELRAVKGATPDDGPDPPFRLTAIPPELTSPIDRAISHLVA